jgi:hypothetical protein
MANFQKITTGGPISIDLINWPSSVGEGATGYGVMRVWINVTNVSHTVTLPLSVTIGVDDIAGFDPDTYTITFDAPGNYSFDFSSIDNGTNFLIFDITRNRATLRDPGLYFNSTVNPALLINYTQESFQAALSLEQGQDVVSVRGSINSTASGDLSTANHITQSYNDGINATQGMAGYSTTSARGNIWLGDVVGVENNDFIGYFNNYAYTGDNDTGNAFMAMSGINFFAKGADVQAGLGGNVAIFTAPDGQGDLSNARMLQAVGIEQDQSVQFFGNIFVANTFVPTSSTSNGTAGQISFNSNNIYICLGPNNWKKASLTTF